MTDTPTAVAWTLTCPSVSGRKEYRVLVFNDYVVVGWGVMDGPIQYKVHTKANPEDARIYALHLTSQKEVKGYTLYRGPMRTAPHHAVWLGWMPEYTSVRGSEPYFDTAFRSLFIEGIELAG